MNLRWMIRRDMPEVLSIEQNSFDDPWPEEDFIRVLRNRNCIGMVCEDNNGKILGFVIYELNKNEIYVLNLAANPTRQGVGSFIINKMKAKLSTQRRNQLRLTVRDKNLPCHLFLKKHEFHAVSVLKNFYDTGEDAYQFVFGINENAQSNTRTNQNIAV